MGEVTLFSQVTVIRTGLPTPKVRTVGCMGVTP